MVRYVKNLSPVAEALADRKVAEMAPTTRYEALREAIASKSMSYEDMRDMTRYALLEALQALDYEDWTYLEERALFVADVSKGLARR